MSRDRTHKSVALEHSEWLSLLDVDGPFLSLPVLLDVFPQGLERVDAARRQQLRALQSLRAASGLGSIAIGGWLSLGG